MCVLVSCFFFKCLGAENTHRILDVRLAKADYLDLPVCLQLLLFIKINDKITVACAYCRLSGCLLALHSRFLTFVNRCIRIFFFSPSPLPKADGQGFKSFDRNQFELIWWKTTTCSSQMCRNDEDDSS